MTLKENDIFYSRWLVNLGNRQDLPLNACLPIKVISIVDDNVTVDYESGAGYENWNLHHVLSAFKIGEYSFTLSTKAMFEKFEIEKLVSAYSRHQVSKHIFSGDKQVIISPQNLS